MSIGGGVVEKYQKPDFGGLVILTGRFVLLAVCTTANIVLNILCHLWPVEVTVDHFHGFIHALWPATWLSCSASIIFKQSVGSLGIQTLPLRKSIPSLYVTSMEIRLSRNPSSTALSYSPCQIKSSAAFEMISYSSHWLILTSGLSPTNWTDATMTSL